MGNAPEKWNTWGYAHRKAGKVNFKIFFTNIFFVSHFVILAILIITAKLAESFSCEYYLKYHSHLHSNSYQFML